MSMTDVERELSERGRDGPRRAKTMIWIEPGIFRRVSWRTRAVIPWLWVHYPGKDGTTVREPVKPRTTDVRRARKFRANRMAAVSRGEPGREAERLNVGQLLDGYLTDAEVNHRRSLVTMRGHVKALRLACQRAGVPYGRQRGGITYHCTRNTAATNLRAAGMDEADAMKVLGHKTASIFRRYNLGDTETLRDRLTRANAWVRSLPTRRPVVPLRGGALPSVAS